MTNSQPLVRVVATVVVIVFALGIWLSGEAPQASWLRFYSSAILVATGALAAWDHFLWHLPLAQRFSRVPRDIRGTWKGTITSLWTDPATGKTPGPMTAFLVVRQTASRVSLVQLTQESTSRSMLTSLTEADGVATLAFMYLSSPDPRVEHRSRMHNGSGSLQVSGRPAARLRGRYWTDRDTRGEVDFAERRLGRADDYLTAERLFSTAQS